MCSGRNFEAEQNQQPGFPRNLLSRTTNKYGSEHTPIESTSPATAVSVFVFPEPMRNKQTDRQDIRHTHTPCGTNSTTLSPESTLPGVSELVIPQQPTQGYWEHALWRLPPRADMRCAATVNKRIAFTRYFPLRLPCRHAAMPSVTIPFLHLSLSLRRCGPFQQVCVYVCVSSRRAVCKVYRSAGANRAHNKYTPASPCTGIRTTAA